MTLTCQKSPFPGNPPVSGSFRNDETDTTAIGAQSFARDCGKGCHSQSVSDLSGTIPKMAKIPSFRQMPYPASSIPRSRGIVI
jgi:hypothetical protein